jgi:hypothetical protein
LSGRRKISTTVSASTFAYLQSLIESGKAQNLAEALDLSVRGLRRAERRAALERATAAYFQSLSAEGAQEEGVLEDRLDSAVDEMDFDAC